MRRPSSTRSPSRATTASSASSRWCARTQWRAADSLVHVAGVRPADRVTLRAGRVNTIARLAALDREIPGLDESRRDRFVRQAKLQVAAREQHLDAPPPFELVTTPTAALNSASETEAVGFAAMPAPDDGDVFLDFEGHPFWRADVGLFFLFGWIERERRRRLGVQGAVGARPGRGGGGDQGSSSTTSTPAASGSRTCTCTTTTTPSARRWCG